MPAGVDERYQFLHVLSRRFTGTIRDSLDAIGHVGDRIHFDEKYSRAVQAASEIQLRPKLALGYALHDIACLGPAKIALIEQAIYYLIRGCRWEINP